MSFVKFPSVEPFFIRIHNVGKTGIILIFFLMLQVLCLKWKLQYYEVFQQFENLPRD